MYPFLTRYTFLSFVLFYFNTHLVRDTTSCTNKVQASTRVKSRQNTTNICDQQDILFKVCIADYRQKVTTLYHLKEFLTQNGKIRIQLTLRLDTPRTYIWPSKNVSTEFTFASTLRSKIISSVRKFQTNSRCDFRLGITNSLNIPLSIGTIIYNNQPTQTWPLECTIPNLILILRTSPYIQLTGTIWLPATLAGYIVVHTKSREYIVTNVSANLRTENSQKRSTEKSSE